MRRMAIGLWRLLPGAIIGAVVLAPWGLGYLIAGDTGGLIGVGLEVAFVLGLLSWEAGSW